MPMRIVRRAVRNFSTPAARYPADPRVVFILLACVLAGTASLTADATPGSIAAKLDHVWVVAWGAMITLGAAVTLTGTFKMNPTGVILEQIGCVAVAGASALYAGAILSNIGWTGLFPGLIQAMFGTASLWRAGQLQGLINQGRRLAVQRADDRADRGEPPWDEAEGGEQA